MELEQADEVESVQPLRPRGVRLAAAEGHAATKGHSDVHGLCWSYCEAMVLLQPGSMLMPVASVNTKGHGDDVCSLGCHQGPY